MWSSAPNCKKTVFLQIAKLYFWNDTFHWKEKKMRIRNTGYTSALDFIQSSVNPVLLGWFKTCCNLWAAPLNIAELLPRESKLLQTYSSNVCGTRNVCWSFEWQWLSKEGEAEAVLFWGRQGIQNLSLTVKQWHWEAIKYWEDVLDRQVKMAAGTSLLKF